MLTHGLDEAVAPKRTVIVGAGGFVGRAIIEKLQARGANVLAIGRQDVDLLASEGPQRLQALLNPDDALVLVAAVAPVKDAAMLRDNITIIQTMADVVRSVQPSYVLNIGSDAVFADSPSPLNENSCKSPGSLHGIMHLTREVMLADAYEGQIATLRPTLIYGLNDPHNGYGPNRFRRLVDDNQPIALFGEGEERRDHVWVEDVAELACRMIYKRSVGSLNAATGEVISFNELAVAINKLAGSPVDIVGQPRQGVMPHDGYRPFDASATAAAFPDFTYIAPRDGVARVKQQAEQA